MEAWPEAWATCTAWSESPTLKQALETQAGLATEGVRWGLKKGRRPEAQGF